MTMPVRNIVAAIVFAMIGIAYGLLSSGLPDRTEINVPGPAFFPQLVAGFVVLLSMALLYNGISELRKSRPVEIRVSVPTRATLLVAWFALFIFTLPYLGFLFAGVPFFAGLMLMCDSRRWLQILIASVVIPVVLFYLFRDGFQILLPHAQWM